MQFAETRDKVRKMRESLDAEAIGALAAIPIGDRSKSGSGLLAHGPRLKSPATVEELKTLLGSEQFMDSLDEITATHQGCAGRLQARLHRTI